MTLQEWTAQIVDELKREGFDASQYQGFPLVKPEMSTRERVRLLKFATSLGAERHIYAEGMLFIPSGLGVILREK